MDRPALQSIRWVLAQVSLRLAEAERNTDATDADRATLYLNAAEVLRGQANVLDELAPRREPEPSSPGDE